MSKDDLRKKLFIKEYLKNKNPEMAAINAGYAKTKAINIADNLLKNPEIIEAIKKEDEETNFKYTIKESFEQLKKAQILALKKTKTHYTKEGEAIVENDPDLSIFMRAEELKGKLMGLYVDNVKTEVSVNCMGKVKIFNRELLLKIGENTEENLDENVGEKGTDNAE